MLNVIKRMAGILLAMVHTRAELFAVETEEQVQRFFAYLMLSLLGLFCLGMTVFFASILIITLFWETHRIAAVAGMMVFFGVAAVGLFLGVRSAFRNRPRYLAATLKEIARDVETLSAQGRRQSTSEERRP